jgi:hypothetical protein
MQRLPVACVGEAGVGVVPPGKEGREGLVVAPVGAALPRKLGQM